MEETMCEERSNEYFDEISGDYDDEQSPSGNQHQYDFAFNFDQLSRLSKPKDYYKILQVDYDASEEEIRSNYIRLALQWHPDKKRMGEEGATSRFQEINEAYQVLSDPVKRHEYDSGEILHGCEHYLKKRPFAVVYVVDRCKILQDYLNYYKGLILTCNGLGMRHSLW